ncbi:MAG: efflux RND transporter periplasmic adaptor subunit [Opitutaceae bacterium]|nr:efflux RND transporter periplasmic adaptor subunit [Opitutaceae bacterium]
MKLFRLLLLLAILPAGLTATPAQIYQCPMHPWIKSEHPGDKCTICGMALVAATAADPNVPADPNLVTLTPAQHDVVGVATTAVTRGTLVRSLRFNGVVDDDETRHRILAARVPGRVEKLFVNFVGAEVKAGEPLVTIYSPEMLTAQRTYVEQLRGGEAFAPSVRAAARERLLELGLTGEEIHILENTLEPTAMVTVRAPMSGTVVSRAVYEGQYVALNDRLFEIGDFSRMWFVFDVYEPDLAWLQTGQTVEIALPSLPGLVLTGPINFIDPNLNETTRTARARVILDNPDRRVMHRQTGAGTVRVETPDVLLVPRSAVLQHSGQPVVFIEQKDRTYAAREITLGRTGDEFAAVLGGLAVGDQVVTQGALILDGQAQLAHAAAAHTAHAPAPAPEKIAAEPTTSSGAAYAALRELAFAAADAARALANDDLAAYQRALPGLRDLLPAYLAAAPHNTLATFQDTLGTGTNLRDARRAFEPFSTALADLVREAHLHHREGLHVFQCPMTPVLGTGRWLSRDDQLRNPFFGAAMLECGEELE